MKRYKHSVCTLFLLCLYAARSRAEELTLNVNFRQPISVTDEKFLSLTLDPAALFHGNALSTDFEKSINLAKALSPAYVRLGGAHGTFYQYTDQHSQDVEGNQNLVLTESEWVAAYNWAEKAGLNVIVCITPENFAKEQQRESESLEDAGNIVSFSNHMGFNTSWQLGYECQSRCNTSASDLSRQLVTLRKMLNEFPRYSNSLVIGPDIVAYETDKQKQYLRDYFSVAAPALSAITWHPDFDSIVLDNEGVLIREDVLDKDKEELFKVIGRFSKKRPLWIAESKPEECKNLYLGALVLARRLGSAAKLKVNVVMRQPSDLTQPTPDYWVSLLHKTLVGREVFDARVQSLNKSHVYLYCQCTRPSNRYRKGSITIFGVNLSPETVKFDLKGAKITTFHEYILSPGFDAPNRMFAESVLLNNESLSLVNDTVPDLEPVILTDPKGLELNLQSGGIGFWVLPELQIKSCMEDRESSEMQNNRNSLHVPQGLRKKVEDAKARVTRSTRENVRSERKKEGNGSRLSRRPDVRRELKRLRRFVKRKLNDYDVRRLTVEGSSDSKAENRAIRQSKDDDQSDPQNDMQAKLQDFKNRLSRLNLNPDTVDERKVIENSVSEVVAKTMSLISKIQDALKVAKRETDYTERAATTGTVRSYLQVLYDLLANTNLTELSDILESEDHKSNQQSKRTKREVSKMMAEPTLNFKIEDLQKKQRADNVRERRNDRRIRRREDIRVQPSAVQLGTSDSGEHTFYGFFKTKPVEGFPEGDVFFSADGHPASMVTNLGYQRDEPALPQYDDLEELYDEYSDESSETTEDPSKSDTHVDPAESWAAETYQRQKNTKPDDAEGSKVKQEDQAGQQEVQTGEDQGSQNSENHLRQLTGYYTYSVPQNDRSNTFKLKRSRSVIRPVRVRRIPAGKIKLGEQKSMIWDLDADSVPKDADFPSDVEVYPNRRPRRGHPDLYKILDQEMIKEDDANSKDCKCRVIRSKRQAPESVEDETSVEEVTEEDITLDPVPEVLDSHNVADVEVFSDIKDTPMEILQMQTEPSNVKVERNAEMSLPGGSSLDLEEIQAPNEPLNVKVERNAETFLPSGSNEQIELEEIQAPNEPLNVKVERNAEASLPNESSSDLEEIQAPNSSNLPSDTSLNSAESLENSTPSRLSRDSSMLGLTTESEWNQPLTTSTNPEESTFFRGQPGKSEEQTATINTFEDTTEYTSSSRENSPADENGAKEDENGANEAENAKEIEVSRAETPGSTLESATLSDEGIAEAAENDYNNDKAAGGSLKRHAETEEASQEPVLKVRGVGTLSSSGSRQSRKRGRGPLKKKPISSEVKPWERRLFENTRILLTLKKMLDEKKENAKVAAAQLRQTAKNGESQRNRSEQYQKLKERLRERRQRLMQKRISKDEAEDEYEDEEERNLRRREVREMIKNGDDYEQSDYVLMYEPNKYEEKGDDITDEETEKRDVPATEIVRARNVRERIFNPKNSPNFHDQAILESSNPSEMTEIIQLKNLYENEGARGERSSEDKKGKSYFALVEDLENPRIFHYQKSRDQQKRSIQVSPRFHTSEYSPSWYRPYPENIEVIEDSNEEDEEPDDPFRSQEIYIIDPSTYRGGHPILQLYRDPSIPRRVNQKAIGNEYETIWEPVFYKPYRIRQTDPRKREDSVTKAAQRNSDQAKQETRLQDSSTDLNASQLLKILINSLDLQSAEELLKILADQSTASVQNQNFMRSISGESREESREDSSQAREEDGQDPEEWKDSEISDRRVKEKRGSYQDPSMEKETKGEDDTPGSRTAPNAASSSEGILNREGMIRARKRRDTGDQIRKDYSVRKVPREIKKGGQDNYLCLREGPEGTSDEDSSTVFKIVKQSEYYKAVPVKDVKTPKNLRKRFLPLKETRSKDDSRKHREFLEQLSIFSPSELNKYSTIQGGDDVIVGAKKPHGKLSVEYQDVSGSLEDKSEMEISEESVDVSSSDYADENASDKIEFYKKNKEDESEEHANLKELLLSDKPEVLMLLPWARKLGRHRREAMDQEKVDVSVEKEQPLKLQQLEEISSPRTPTYADDVEKSIAQKRPLKMHTKEENLANYINERKRLGKSSNENSGFSSFIEGSIPKLQNVVVDGLKKAQNLTSSMEQLIENVDQKFNETSKSSEQGNPSDSKSITATRYAFHNAIMHVKKLFMILGGITHILHG